MDFYPAPLICGKLVVSSWYLLLWEDSGVTDEWDIPRRSLVDACLLHILKCSTHPCPL